MGILRCFEKLHAVGLVTNGSALVLDLLFREEDMVQKDFNSVVFASFSAHFRLFVDPATHAYIHPRHRCTFPESNTIFLSPGSIKGFAQGDTTICTICQKFC